MFNPINEIKKMAMEQFKKDLASFLEENVERFNTGIEKNGYAQTEWGFGSIDKDYMGRVRPEIEINASGFDRDESCETTVQVFVWCKNEGFVKDWDNHSKYTYYLNLLDGSIRLAEKPSH